MQRKGYVAAILGMVLTVSMFLAGCDNFTTSPGSSSPGNSGELDGTWKNGNYEIIIDGDNYVMKNAGTNYGKGSISYSVANSTFTFQSTHAWQYSAWVPYTETTNGKLTYHSGNTLIISNLNNYTFLTGTWIRQSSSTGNTDPKTIKITGFLGSAYSGKIAVIMLSPSLDSIASEDATAVGVVPVSGATLSFPLFSDVDMTARWNGTGDFIIVLGVIDASDIEDMEMEKMFIYSKVLPNYTGSNVSKYRITDTVSTIPFTDFYDVADLL
jgi:hypothetical protein